MSDGQHERAAFARGWMRHPMLPRPADDMTPIFERRGADGKLHVVDEDDEDEVYLTGDVYPDGSCTHHTIQDLSRASWGVVQLDANNEIEARVSGVVPRFLPQTSGAGEWFAFGVVCGLARGEVRVHQDYLAVTKEWPRTIQAQLRPTESQHDHVMGGCCS